MSDYPATTCTAEISGDDECGVMTVADGYCRMISEGEFRCTIPCAADADCKSGGTCNGSGRCVW